MNLKTILGTIAAKSAKPLLKAQQHSPTTLFIAGAVGVVVTVVLASRATLKLDSVVEKTEAELEKINQAKKDREDYTEADFQKDSAVVYIKAAVDVAKLYGPTVVVGILSIGALSGSHVILSRRNVALTAAYTALDKGFRRYRQRVVEEYGLEKDSEFYRGVRTREIVEETSEGPVVKPEKFVAPGDYSAYAQVFDRNTSHNWSPSPGYNAMFIRTQQNWANDMLNGRGFLFLNDVHKMLGLPLTKAGQVVGWVKNGRGDGYVDFGVLSGSMQSTEDFLNGHEPSVVLDFNVDGVVLDLIEGIQNR